MFLCRLREYGEANKCSSGYDWSRFVSFSFENRDVETEVLAKFNLFGVTETKPSADLNRNVQVCKSESSCLAVNLDYPVAHLIQDSSTLTEQAKTLCTHMSSFISWSWKRITSTLLSYLTDSPDSCLQCIQGRAFWTWPSHSSRTPRHVIVSHVFCPRFLLYIKVFVQCLQLNGLLVYGQLISYCSLALLRCQMSASCLHNHKETWWLHCSILCHFTS